MASTQSWDTRVLFQTDAPERRLLPTIRTILRRLEQKGYLTHDAEGRAYMYQTVEPRHGLAARAVRQIIDRF